MEMLGWLIFVCIITAVAGLFVYAFIKSHKPNKKTPSPTYTQGEIMDIYHNQSSVSMNVVIQYTVGQTTYSLTELLLPKNMDAQKGQTVIVAYNVQDPAKAFWVANQKSQ